LKLFLIFGLRLNSNSAPDSNHTSARASSDNLLGDGSNVWRFCPGTASGISFTLSPAICCTNDNNYFLRLSSYYPTVIPHIILYIEKNYNYLYNISLLFYHYLQGFTCRAIVETKE
jgi:hypothetical protein